MLQFCNNCRHTVENTFYSPKQKMCYACVKLDKWRTQQNKEQPNILIELLFNGHWKAYLIQQGSSLRDLIASGHIKQELFDSSETIVLDLLKKAIQWNVRKHYTPDPKYRFEGLMRNFYIKLELSDADIMRVLMRAKSMDYLPTLRMKAEEWMLWLPKIDREDPQLRQATFTIRCFNYEDGKQVEAIALSPQLESPFKPARLIFKETGRFLVYLDVQKRGTFILDCDVDRRALE